MFTRNEHIKIMNTQMVVIVLMVSTSDCGSASMGSNPINYPTEDCQSGLSYLFAKEMVAKAAQRFESFIFRLI